MYVAKQISKHTEYVGELAWPLLNNELYRLATFAKYPLKAAKSAVSLAADGFVYTGQDDSVTCIFCQSHKNKWQPTDNIRETHRALSCNCPMVTRTFCSNIPVKAKRNHNLIIQSIAPCIIQQKATCDALSSASAPDQLNTIRALTIQATENVSQYSPAKNVSNLATVETKKHLPVQNVSNLATVLTGKHLSVQNVSNLATVLTGKHLSVQNVSNLATVLTGKHLSVQNVSNLATMETEKTFISPKWVTQRYCRVSWSCS
ncbi:baculoviral IAP repeat-containing protein 2-like isoform X1 [Biomphalaria glabrata]|nr:baculoviral IAP repeat-containing protein 2-like isoform X1 [Biomphalaria glabrata]KAI8729665.1 baculoviral IAP repeat-containing protein 2-like isoform X1 [Biomphalaria glabrata]